MMPKDQSDPRAHFVGVDFTVEIRAAGVFNHSLLETALDELVIDFFQQKYIIARPCHNGGLGSATGGQWMELLSWVKENWEFLSGAVTVIVASLYKIKRFFARQRSHLVHGVIDPYRPDIIVTVAPRTGNLSADVAAEDKTAFPTVLLLFPELHGALVEKMPTHNFSLRAVRREASGPLNAFFKLKTTTQRDVATMLRKIKKLDAKGSTAPTILMYRQFGLFLRFDVSRSPTAFYRLMRR